MKTSNGVDKKINFVTVLTERTENTKNSGAQKMGNSVQIRFWGVRGSVPAPITSKDIHSKMMAALSQYQNHLASVANGKAKSVEEFLAGLENKSPFTHGGNTSCVEVRFKDQIIVLDMGTGLRLLGNSLIPQMFKDSALGVTFLLSHVHWDHIQGLPFFAPLYINKGSGIHNVWRFYGGTNWQRTAETCIATQMDSPTFPVSWREIEKITGSIECGDMYDRKLLRLDTGVDVLAGKLNHPQETYGFRLSFPGEVTVAYTPGNGPYNPLFPDPRLVTLARGADVWITDCQFTQAQYEGEKGAGGVPRHGWGHSYPEAVAKTAVMAEVKTVVLFHHDPSSSDEKITEMAAHTQECIKGMGGGSTVVAAWEGLEIKI